MTSEKNENYDSKRSGKKWTQSIWDPDEKAFLGRNAKRWLILLLFYAVFYLVLAALFSICMWALLCSLDAKKPYYTLEHSLIGINPGLGFRPQFVDQGSLIWYSNASTEDGIKREKYTDQLDEFLKPYYNRSSMRPEATQALCEFGRATANNNDVACAFDVRRIDACSPNNSYGYKDNTPCIFVKLNKIYGWIPDYYDDPSNLPADMPEFLKAYIQNEASQYERKQVWITCEAEDPADVEALGGNKDEWFKYEPAPGLPHYYFPYLNQPGYISPIVAVKFKQPKLNQIINVRCRAWAKNIEYTKSLRVITGSVHIELMIDT